MVGEGLILLILVDEDHTLDPVPLTAGRQCIGVIGPTLQMIAITEGAAIDLFLEASHQEEGDTLGAAIPRGRGGGDTPPANLQNLGEGQGRVLSGATHPDAGIQGIAILLGVCLRAIVLVQVPERSQGLTRQGHRHLQLK